MNRSDRERREYDQGSVWEHSHKWHTKFGHVFACPNTVHSEAVLKELIKKNIAGKKVLDLGCGNGGSSHEFLSMGAGYVYGIDISEKAISAAKKGEVKGNLEFSIKDVSGPIDGKFDIIFGRAILHHIDYRTILNRLYQTNLVRGGFMFFMEPLGSNLLIKMYHKFVKSAHTQDEKPFCRKELRWLRKNYQNFQIIPVNYTSLPFGVLSTCVFSNADNVMMRICNKVDCWIARNIKCMIPNFRYGIFIIRKS